MAGLKIENTQECSWRPTHEADWWEVGSSAFSGQFIKKVGTKAKKRGKGREEGVNPNSSPPPPPLPFLSLSYYYLLSLQLWRKHLERKRLLRRLVLCKQLGSVRLLPISAACSCVSAPKQDCQSFAGHPTRVWLSPSQTSMVPWCKFIKTLHVFHEICLFGLLFICMWRTKCAEDFGIRQILIKDRGGYSHIRAI